MTAKRKNVIYYPAAASGIPMAKKAISNLAEIIINQNNQAINQSINLPSRRIISLRHQRLHIGISISNQRNLRPASSSHEIITIHQCQLCKPREISIENVENNISRRAVMSPLPREMFNQA